MEYRRVGKCHALNQLCDHTRRGAATTVVKCAGRLRASKGFMALKAWIFAISVMRRALELVLLQCRDMSISLRVRRFIMRLQRPLLARGNSNGQMRLHPPALRVL